MSEEKHAVSDADAVLFQRVYLPCFLKAAADRGIVPQSESDLENMLKIAAGVRVAEEQEVRKSASTISTVLEKSAGVFDRLLGVQKSAGSDVDVSGLLGDPEIAGALGALKA